MATIAEYLLQLQADKEALINSLSEKGVEVAADATFTTLVPKVDEVEEVIFDNEVYEGKAEIIIAK